MPILFTLVGQSHGIRNKGIPALLLGRTPLPSIGFRLAGITKDSTGAALPNCTVSLYRTLDDALMERVMSDGAGAYAFAAVGPAEAYYVVAYKPGGPDVTGATVNTLVGT